MKLGARLGLVSATIVLLGFGSLGVLAVLPAVSPMTGAQVADWIRSVVGPRPVAVLEGESLALQDVFNQFVAAHNGGQPTISLAQIAPSGYTPQTQTKPFGPGTSVGSQHSAGKLASPVGSGNVVTSAPQIGWQSFGPVVNGGPVMAQTLLTADPQRRYAAIALVRIDLSQLRLHMMPGSQEPSHAVNVVRALPNLGLTPAADQAHLVAGFNGGFKAINGQYGMMVNGVTLLPPLPGLATLALYNDGHVAIGVWGQSLGPSPDMLAFRQNCPAIVQDGRINPQVFVDNRIIWGNTIGNKAITWRTAVGLTHDRRYLIYAVGNGSTVETVAQALLQAGAYNAMQLDINRPFARFVTYQPAGLSAEPLKAVPLLAQMPNDPMLYLVPSLRDYFYLTTP
jgi:phosphodiester glycosidase